QWRGTIKLLRIGTRRQYCDWSYPLAEQRLDLIGMLLPDCQSMRQWAKVLKLKAGVEIAEHDYDQAVDTIETGFAFGRHVGEGPFVINNLVGNAICSVMLERVEELISQPGAPNLYWALTALPLPLVSMREALETEQRMGENTVPELSQMDEDHSRAEWAVLLEKLYDRVRHLAERITSDKQVNARLRSQLDLDLASFKKENLAPSQKYLKTIHHMDAQRVKAMSEDEVVTRALVGQYRDMRDDQFKLGYLPWRDARSRIKEAEQRLKTVKAGLLTVLAELQPTIINCLDAQMRLDRRVAALRVVEAIRLYAASHDGKLPEELNQITEVPGAEDPATGKPFEYRRDGAAAVLALPDAGMTGRPTPSYRISIRKRTNEYYGAGSGLLTSCPSGQNRAHKPEAQAKGVRKCISLNALRLRFRLVASDFPGIVCILDSDRSGVVEVSDSSILLWGPGVSGLLARRFRKPGSRGVWASPRA